MPIPAHFALHRQWLQQRRDSLRGTVDAGNTSALERITATSLDVTDRKQATGPHGDLELPGGDSKHAVAELVRIEVALQRLEAGTYGDCIDCGNVIAPARLRVQPTALRCSRCQVTAESHPP